MIGLSFSSEFISAYSDAFNELVRLGVVASEKRTNGRSSEIEDSRSQRILQILLALKNAELSAKQIEALEFCLIRLNVSLVVPTVGSVGGIGSLLPDSLVPLPEVEEFSIGDGADILDYWGDSADISSYIPA